MSMNSKKAPGKRNGVKNGRLTIEKNERKLAYLKKRRVRKRRMEKQQLTAKRLRKPMKMRLRKVVLARKAKKIVRIARKKMKQKCLLAQLILMVGRRR